MLYRNQLKYHLLAFLGTMRDFHTYYALDEAVVKRLEDGGWCSFLNETTASIQNIVTDEDLEGDASVAENPLTV